MRKIALALSISGALLLAACGGSSSSESTDAAKLAAGSGNECTAGKTLNEGVLTIGTGSPAYGPWVVDDKPESKEGFEAAVAYAVAAELGFSDANVKWVRTTFDEAIQPGKKNFDFNLQQYSITEERKKTVSFSDGYYTTNQAIVGLTDSAAKGATTLADIKKLKLGAQSGTTAKAALEANQIDAAIFDLPTALYVSAVEIEGSAVLGQFPADASASADEFGLVFDLENELVGCANTALAAIKDNGSLAEITSTWLSSKAEIPVIK